MLVSGCRIASFWLYGCELVASIWLCRSKLIASFCFWLYGCELVAIVSGCMVLYLLSLLFQAVECDERRRGTRNKRRGIRTIAAVSSETTFVRPCLRKQSILLFSWSFLSHVAYYTALIKELNLIISMTNSFLSAHTGADTGFEWGGALRILPISNFF